MKKILCFVLVTYFAFSQTPTSWEFVKKTGQKLIFKSGFSYNTKLYDLKFISVLGNSPKPYFLVAGRSCNNCGENMKIYILGLNDIKKPIDSVGSYLYPGTLRDYENNKIISSSKMFYGKCIKANSNDFVIWVQNDVNDFGKTIKSIYLVEITPKGLLEKQIKSSELQYKKILSALNTKCRELKGLELTSEP